MVFFGLGGLLQLSVLLINAIAILSEDRFLARIGWTSSADPGFGGQRDDGIKARLVNLVSSVRTLMRSTTPHVYQHRDDHIPPHIRLSALRLQNNVPPASGPPMATRRTCAWGEAEPYAY
ncbi:hypothetical protein PMIN01_06191 [Paraphaeosphaeria minitans]|uniref:Yos1-like protein n=1 Tax=Paraphaeosphaeria minitans TaxID=565426 RepID=A0A9P6GJF0_9PLEO|nr:hypothetical protein PMIN01_06191 [Paraphaeosphaeria minitans]